MKRIIFGSFDLLNDSQFSNLWGPDYGVDTLIAIHNDGFSVQSIQERLETVKRAAERMHIPEENIRTYSTFWSLVNLIEGLGIQDIVLGIADSHPDDLEDNYDFAWALAQETGVGVVLAENMPNTFNQSGVIAAYRRVVRDLSANEYLADLNARVEADLKDSKPEADDAHHYGYFNDEVFQQGLTSMVKLINDAKPSVTKAFEDVAKIFNFKK